ncbi:unnamed protein product [Ilex paraguariensis]|uniref:Uncharacterized protein n=1 Tax=Ilex paraguariensis TaxID=185542 RepID=A0ABC8RTE7_9AQUA
MAKSKRRIFLIGPLKFKLEMEHRAIKERQGRHVPTPMFSAYWCWSKREKSMGDGKVLTGKCRASTEMETQI